MSQDNRRSGLQLRSLVKPDGTLTGDLTYPAKYAPDQHKYGPWAAMITEQTNLQNQYLVAPNTPPNCQPWP